MGPGTQRPPEHADGPAEPQTTANGATGHELAQVADELVKLKQQMGLLATPAHAWGPSQVNQVPARTPMHSLWFVQASETSSSQQPSIPVHCVFPHRPGGGGFGPLSGVEESGAGGCSASASPPFGPVPSSGVAASEPELVPGAVDRGPAVWRSFQPETTVHADAAARATTRAATEPVARIPSIIVAARSRGVKAAEQASCRARAGSKHPR
jgi:hypothetical protein